MQTEIYLLHIYLNELLLKIGDFIKESINQFEWSGNTFLVMNHIFLFAKN